MSGKSNYLIGRIKGRAIVGLTISMIVVLMLAASVFAVLRSYPSSPSDTPEEPAATVLTTLEEIIAAENSPSFFEVTVTDLRFIQDLSASHNLFVGVLPATGEGVVVEITKEAIPDVNNLPAEYRIVQAYTSLNNIVCDYVRDALFEGSFEEFEKNYTSYVIMEVTAALLEPTTDTDSSGWTNIIGVAFLLLPLVFVLHHLIRLLSPRSHKAYKKLAADSRNIEQELNGMDQEVSGNQMKKFGGTTITPSWVIDETMMKLQVLRMESIIWFYRVNINTTRRGFTAKSYAVSLCDKDGNTHAINTFNEKKVNEMLEAMALYNPGAIMGHSYELEQMYANNIQKMIAAVNENRSTQGGK